MATINTKKSLPRLVLCHRLPDRTFKIGKYHFPMCTRCTGLYIGAFFYFTFVYFNYVQYNLFFILFGMLIMFPILIDGLTQFLGYRESNNILRFSTGLIASIGLGILVKGMKWFLIS